MFPCLCQKRQSELLYFVETCHVQAFKRICDHFVFFRHHACFLLEKCFMSKLQHRNYEVHEQQERFEPMVPYKL